MSDDLRQRTWEVASLIGLEASEATFDELNHQDPPFIQCLPVHLRLVGAWAEAVELLRFEREVAR